MELLLPSCFLLIISFALWWPLRKHGGFYTISLILIWLLGICLSAFYYGVNYFTGQGINDAALFHFQHILNWKVIRQFYPIALATAILLAICATLVLIQAQKPKPSKIATSRTLLALFPLLGSLAVHPALHDASELIKRQNEVSGPDILGIQLKIQQDTIIARTPRNFVHLYIESLDQIFFDEKIFPGLLPELSKVLATGQKIGNIYQTPLTAWTMAGIVSTQCGLPLGRTATTLINQQSGKTNLCIGDILKKERYYLSFIGGADATFAGKGNFFQSHGFDEVLGGPELKALEAQDLLSSDWGIYDDDLLRIALKRIEKIANENERFGVALLTLDTHPPHGHRTPSCEGLTYGDGKSGVLNAIHCADRLISKFIRDLLSAPYAENLVLFVSSDHIMMANDSGIYPDDKNTRENTFVFFTSAPTEKPAPHRATMLDLAPSMLHLLGFEVDTLGFGRNLFSDSPTLLEQHGKAEFFRLMYVWRNHLQESWKTLTD